MRVASIASIVPLKGYNLGVGGGQLPNAHGDMTEVDQQHTTGAGADVARASADSFLAHWQSLPMTGLMPHLRAYLDCPLPALQPHVAIVDVTPGGGFRTRLVGTGRVKLYERDLTNQDPRQMFSDEAKPVVAMLAKATVLHPCGNRGSQTIMTSSGQTRLGITMALPLAVDNPDAHCFVHYQHLVEPLEFDETAVKIAKIVDYEWIDIGAGTPN